MSLRTEVHMGRHFLAEATRVGAARHRVLRDYLPWRRSLSSGRGPMDHALPWVTFEATRLLLRILRPNMRVFEYGSGGSTLFFAKAVREVFTVEHDRAWFEVVQERVRALALHNVRLRLVEPERAEAPTPREAWDPDRYRSADERFGNHQFERYARAIDDYPGDSFDVILIDGRARPSCLKHALPKLAPAGHLVLDNSEREYYASAMALVPRTFRRIETHGPVPFLKKFGRTTIWRRPS